VTSVLESVSPSARRLRSILDRIERARARSASAAASVSLGAVTKQRTVEEVRPLLEAGVAHVGENRVQEAQRKRDLLPRRPPLWHLVGHLQTNKAKLAVESFDRIDSIDSVRVATEVARAAEARRTRVPILLEVNVSGEPQKHGFAPDDLDAALRETAAAPALEVLGLMTLAPLDDDPEASRSVFRSLRELRDAAARRLGRPLPILSMGMTNDFEVAVEEGATEVRIGRALFEDAADPSETRRSGPR
jgi:hypothetical protein